jgi:hypothetical protein
MTVLDSNDFLTSGILSWAVPIALVLGVCAWWGVVLARRALEAERDGR